MNPTETWREIAADHSGEIVLAADFDVAGRPEARFADLAPLLAPRHTVWVTDPWAVADAPGDRADSYVKRWVDEVDASGRPVRAVLGFCGGAVYAAAIADELERRHGRSPRILLFDPERPTALGMYFQFCKALDQLAPALGPAEIGRAQEAAQYEQVLAADLTDYATALLRIFLERGREAFDRLDLSEAHRAEFTGAVRIFLAFMAAAEQVDHGPAWRRATAISSSTPTSGLNGHRLLNPGQAAGLVGTEVRCQVPHVDLLRSATTADLVSGLL
ncbi:hypothetical protein HII36_47235 [Nonomuraea sp. NN258]|uniref:hypothetical protein n=1 Tax=Nonomuraea antri TaxID=2730852 RepID=UPI001568F33F|nr:hypothetical protein [Nonomuraea antri]NRQ39369.1 hypothetical protein [Nonomuraea antri]